MKRLELLDYGRFFAALGVVAFHYFANGITTGEINSITHMQPIAEISKYGYLGVELFFMISGYVIFQSARNRTASQFAVSRAVRLYPSYWFAVLFTSIFVSQWAPQLVNITPTDIVANLTMFQFALGFESVDGVYWTLAYEMAFYIGVGTVLIGGFQKSLDKIVIFWPFVMALALVSGLNSIPYLGSYFYYFAAGSLFALLRERTHWLTIVSLALTFTMCVSLSMDDATLSTQEGIYLSRNIVAGVVVVIFLFFFLQNTQRLQNFKLPLSKTLGALTYPVYLIHANFGYVLINNFATDDNKIFIYAVTFATVLAVSYGVYRIIEVKMHLFWKSLFNATLGILVNEIQMFLVRIRALKSTQHAQNS